MPPTQHWVRLKPYNRRAGHFLIRLTVEGHRFDVSKGWYVISDERLVKILRDIRQRPGNMDTKLAFDVCDSIDDARKVELADTAPKLTAEERIGAAHPIGKLPPPESSPSTQPAPSTPEPSTPAAPGTKPKRGGRRKKA